MDKVLIINQKHLQQVMREFIAHYNTARPHQDIAQQTPIPQLIAASHGPVRCRNVLGGVIHEYHREAA
ncbi:MAG: transposase [Anaerolineae bacterium]|nr:transposase [Anaerolineae bacterium]